MTPTELRGQAADTLRASCVELRRVGTRLCHGLDVAGGMECLRAATECERVADNLVPFHRCSCGLTYTQEAWEELPLVGFMGHVEDGERSTMEMRTCPGCASTRSVEVKP